MRRVAGGLLDSANEGSFVRRVLGDPLDSANEGGFVKRVADQSAADSRI